jgi:hypothetical protein
MMLCYLCPVEKDLMRASAGQWGLNSASCSVATLEAVADMNGPWSKDEASEGSLFFAATIHLGSN